MHIVNLFNNLPANLAGETFETLLSADSLRIERIVSLGHSSPASGWYDQAWAEWVLLLKGAAELLFEDGETIRLRPGDQLLIPAHRRHRVAWTTPEEPTLWLAVHYAS